MSPPTLVAPKATCAMIHVSRSAKCLRELNETKDDEDGLVFKKRRVAPPSDQITVPQVKKVKPTPHYDKLNRQLIQMQKEVGAKQQEEKLEFGEFFKKLHVHLGPQVDVVEPLLVEVTS